jgi:hypothetical protein
LRSRALTFTALAVTHALWTANFGLVDLIDGLTGFVDQSRNQVLDAGWGALFGVVLPAGLLAQLRRPEARIAGLQQIGVAVVALAAAATAGGEWRYLALVAGLSVALAGVLALHPARASFLHRGDSIRPRLAVLAAVAAVPCLVYAARMVAAQRRNDPPLDAVSNGLHHWTAMAAVALTAVLLVALAALGTRGWRIPALSAALGMLALGVAGLSASSAAGGVGRGWACAAIAWAVAVGAAARLEVR